MPTDYTNPALIKFLKENYEKSDAMRTKWFLNKQKELEAMAVFPEGHKDLRSTDILKLAVELCLPAVTSQHHVSRVNRRKKPLRDGDTSKKRRGEGEDEATKIRLEPEPTMKPVSPDVQSILYQPLPNGGRLQYLENRDRVKPEEKYNFCETSNYVYGWRLHDSKQARQLSTFNRFCVFEHDLRSRTGPHPDPAYYQAPPVDPYSKCYGS